MKIKIRQLDSKYRDCLGQIVFAGWTHLYDDIYEFLKEDVSRREMYLSDVLSLLDSYHAISDYNKLMLFENIEELGYSCSFILNDWFSRNYRYDGKLWYYNRKTMK